MTRRKKDFGEWGEKYACEFLKRNNFEVVETNFYCAAGEIDIVARQGDDYYFVEVKTRYAGEMADSSAVTGEKKRKILNAAKKYCYSRDISGSGLVLAGILLTVDKKADKINFNFFILY